MSWTRLHASLLIALMTAAVARAQSGLGAPQPLDEKRPILGGVARTIIGPPRNTPPPPLIELAPPMVTPTRDDIARMIADGGYSPAEIFAAKIKLDESQVKSRLTAVRYLASVDFHYYPEAETGLLAALRADRNESVRFEAALILGNLRFTTRRIVDSLTVATLGHVTDGFPSETSERVRTMARQSLTRVLANGYPSDYLPTVSNQSTTTLPPLSVPSPQERRVAETIGAPSTPGKASSTSKSLLPWLQSLTLFGRSTNDAGVDPRLRGLNVLGANNSLAIPGSNANPSSRRYNDP